MQLLFLLGLMPGVLFWTPTERAIFLSIVLCGKPRQKLKIFPSLLHVLYHVPSPFFGFFLAPAEAASRMAAAAKRRRMVDLDMVD